MEDSGAYLLLVGWFKSWPEVSDDLDLIQIEKSSNSVSISDDQW